MFRLDRGGAWVDSDSVRDEVSLNRSPRLKSRR